VKVIQKTLRSTRLSYAAGGRSRVPKVIARFGTTENRARPDCCERRLITTLFPLFLPSLTIVNVAA
jgi:hypothetical protein